MKIKFDFIKALFLIVLLITISACDKGDKKEIVKKVSPEKISRKVSIPGKKIEEAKKNIKKVKVPAKVKPETLHSKEKRPEEKKIDVKKADVNKSSFEKKEKSDFIENLLKSGAEEVATEKKDTEKIYNPKGRVNPFSPLIKDTPKKEIVRKVKKKRTRPKTPLEKLDLGQLKLVAVISAPSGVSAILEEASGKGYVVETGTYVGLNSGQITRIESDRIIIVETVEDITGKSIKKESILKIQKPVGE